MFYELAISFPLIIVLYDALYGSVEVTKTQDGFASVYDPSTETTTEVSFDWDHVAQALFDLNVSPRMPGDANGDGQVNINDLSILSASWQKEAGDPGYDIRADFNRDGWDDFVGAGESSSFVRIYRNRTIENLPPSRLIPARDFWLTHSP